MNLVEGKNEEKKDHLIRLLNEGTVMIFIDSRQEGVQVPSEHKDNPQLALNLDYRFNLDDLKISEEEIGVTLSFNRTPFYCLIPMSSIYAMRCEEAQEVAVFLEGLPQKLYAIGEMEAKEDSSPEKRPSFLSVVDQDNEESQVSEKKSSEEKPKKKNHLRLVKSD